MSDLWDPDDLEERPTVDSVPRYYHQLVVLTQSIRWIVRFVQVLILIRVVLRLLGANPQAPFARWLYGITNPFLRPFLPLLPSWQLWGNSVLELSSIIAVFIYGIFTAFGIRLIWIIFHRHAGDQTVTTYDVVRVEHEHDRGVD